jgi:gliding motility-associated-like protein
MLKNKRAFLILALLLFPLVGICQVAATKWAADIGGSGLAGCNLAATIADTQNNIYISGTYTGTVDFDPSAGVYNLTSVSSDPYKPNIFIAKYTTNGTLIWAKSISGTDTYQANSLALDASGNPIISGQFNSAALDADPGTGIYNLHTAGSTDIFIIKLNTTGDFMWAKSIGGIGSEIGGAIKTDSKGNIIQAMSYQGTITIGSQTFTSISVSDSYNGLTIKYDPLGNVIWAINLGDANDCKVLDLAVDNSDNIITTGLFTGTDNFNPLGTPITAPGSIYGTDSGVYLAKYSSAGILIWVNAAYGAIGSSNLCVNSKSEAYLQISGGNMHFNSTNVTAKGTFDVFIAKYSQAGVFQFVKDVGGSQSYCSANTIVAGKDDNIYNAGFFTGKVSFDPSPAATTAISDHGTRDFYLAKYDADLNYKWAFNGGDKSNTSVTTAGRSIAIDNNNDILFAGVFSLTSNFSALTCNPYTLRKQGSYDDAFLVKYSQDAAFQQGQITSISVPQQSRPAVIDQATQKITLTVLPGTNVTALLPTIAYSNNVTLSPASNTPQNFTTPLTYTLTSATSACPTINYTISVLEDNLYITTRDTICSGDTSRLAGDNIPAPGSYLWQHFQNNAWVTATGTVNKKDYTTPVLNNNTNSNITFSYRRQVTVNGNIGYDSYHDVNVQPGKVISHNTISAPALITICSDGPAPGVIAGSVPTGGNGSFNYQWQSSLDDITYTNIVNAKSKDYTPGVISQTTYYRRVVLSGTCNVPAVSNSTRVRVLPPITNTLNFPTLSSYCATFDPASLGGSKPTGGNGIYTYQWQSKSEASFIDIPGATLYDYNPPAITKSTYFRRIVKSGNCSSYSDAIHITINDNPIENNTISASGRSIFCGSGKPLIFSSQVKGGTGKQTFQLQSSTDGVLFTNINAAANNNAYYLAENPITVTTYYRRIVTACAISISDTLVFTVLPESTCSATANPQVCGTSGQDGAISVAGSINTYFPAVANTTLAAGANSIGLSAVPAASYGASPIKAGDLLLIIQMQDATINFSNNNLYGANNALADGSGFTDIGNTGRYEYLVATNDIPLTGGTLTFKGSGTGNGTIYSYVNADAVTTRGTRSFQVIRIPQYANIKLSANASPPPFNGKVGGVIAFSVAGNMDFNNHAIIATGLGFRGGYGIAKNFRDEIEAQIYVASSSDGRISGKGEGIAGTPRYVSGAIDNITEGLPGGSGGRGAPGNAGGGGNLNYSGAGGGGGANGGAGGSGFNGFNFPEVTFPCGGRGGAKDYVGSVDPSRLIMGGGGGAGYANNGIPAMGGVGGGIILINAGSASGTGYIIANGGNGGEGPGSGGGGGGGGAGGSVLIKIANTLPAAALTINALGGTGASTHSDNGPGGEPFGPGGGGGGGLVYYAAPQGSVGTQVDGGLSGRVNNDTTPDPSGQPGVATPFAIASLPGYLQGSNGICYPKLVTTMSVAAPAMSPNPNNVVNYTVKITNTSDDGNAGGTEANISLPSAIVFESATAVYTGAASGPAQLSNIGTGGLVSLGDFNIPPSGTVTITIIALVNCAQPGVYNSSVQAVYFDPTRDITQPNRRITAATNALPGSNTTYQAGGTVPGSNYDGTQSPGEDVTIPNSLTNNTVTQPAQDICGSGNPPALTGSTPAGATGTYTYQWQSSPDSSTFTNINGATAKDYDPATISSTIYYRRIVSSGLCSTPLTSNVVFIKVIPPPATPIPTASVVTITKGSAATLSVSNPQNGITYKWYDAPVQTNVLFTGTTYVTGPLNADKNYYIGAENGTCSSASLATVMVKVTQPLAAPVVEVASVTSTSVTFDWASIPGAEGYEVSTDGGNTFTPPSSGSNGLTHTVTGLQPGQTATMLVRAFGSSPGQLSVSSAAVTATTNDKDNIIYVANLFTPNGDGKNDILLVHSESIKSLKFYVYDQRGEMIFQSTSVNNGWDGTYKGAKEPVGVYIYYLQASMNDGKTVVKKGTITLIR